MKILAALLFALAVGAPTTAAAVKPAGVTTCTIDVLHVDDAAGGGHYDYSLRCDDGTRDRFRVGTADPRFQSGDRVRASWTRGPKGGRIWTVTPLVARAGQAVLGFVGGVHPTLYLVLDLQDARNAIRSPAGFSGAPVADFFTRGSYGRLTMPIDVVGPLPIASSTATCDYYGIAAKADAAAVRAGVTLAKYIHKVYLLPPSQACRWTGLGTVGGNPSMAWLNGVYYPAVFEHELGHNLGLWHSHALRCGPGIALAAGCTAFEYGDTTDTMGGGGGYQFNPAQLRILGWLVPEDVSAGTFALTPLETTPRALRIARPPADWFYVALRGVHASSSGVPYGVIVHYQRGTSGDGIYLLDMTPSTTTFADPALVGAWTDSLSGITIAVNAASATAASVTISGKAPPPPPPTCPPTCPPAAGDVSIAFVDHREPRFVVDVPPIRCYRQTGGSSLYRVATVTPGGVEKLLAGAAAVNPRGAAFTLRCQVTATGVNVYTSQDVPAGTVPPAATILRLSWRATP